MKKRMVQAITVVFVFAIAVWAADSPFSGNWKLNFSKSKNSPLPADASVTMQTEASQEGRTMNIKMIGADGKVTGGRLAVKYDGKDYPATGSPLGDAVSIKKISDRSTQSTWKRNGKVVSIEVSTVAADGRTLTTRTKPANGQGPEIIHVWEKQ